MKDKQQENTDEIENYPIGLNWLIGSSDNFENTEVLQKVGNRTYLVLVIFDVVDNKKRYRISKPLKGYGEWVQRSAFECHLTLRQYEKMIQDIMPYFDFEVDLLRIYRLTGQTEIQIYGKIQETEDEDLIII